MSLEEKELSGFYTGAVGFGGPKSQTLNLSYLL